MTANLLVGWSILKGMASGMMTFFVGALILFYALAFFTFSLWALIYYFERSSKLKEIT